VVNFWNSLTNAPVDVTLLTYLSLNNVWMFQDVKSDYTVDLTGATRSIWVWHWKLL